MSARAALRAATSEAHDRVDRLFSGLQLDRRDDYRAFLLAQAAAHLPMEAALDAAGAEAHLPDWPERRRAVLLRADLADLAEDLPAQVVVPELTSAARMLGAIYVLEGSRLGGAMLKRAIPPGWPKAFLSAPQKPGAWRKLGGELDSALDDTALLAQAIETARQVFDSFYEAGRQHVRGDGRDAA